MDSMVGQLDIVLNASADKATQEIEKVNVKLDQLTSKAQAQAQKMVAGNRASADSLSGIATGVQRNVEAIDKLGQRSDALLGKQHTVWLGIGAVVGGQTDSMIKKVVGFLDRVNAIPGAVESGFRPLIQAQWLANDSLELSNATLKNQIALIEKKPQNNAAVALAEAKIESDKLAASLQAADEKMDAVLSANHISAWRLLLGKGPTANVEGTIKSLNEQISDLGHDSQVALHNGDQDEFNRLDKERRAMLEYAHQHFGEMEKNDQPTGVAGFFQGIGKRFGLKPDTSGSRAMLTQADTMVLAEQDADKGRDTNAEDKAQLRRDQDAERAKQAAQAASAAAQAAREKQYRDQMAGFEQQLAGIELGGELIPVAIEHFWRQARDQTEKGSLAWLDINKRVGASHQRTMRALSEQISRDSEEFNRAREASESGMGAWNRSDARAGDERRDAANELAAVQVHNAGRMQQVALQLAMGHSITSYDAAVKLAAIHTAEYGAEIERLGQKEKDVAGASYLTAAEREKELGRIREEKDTLQSNRGVQMMQDDAAIKPPGSSAWIGAEDALENFVRSTQDAAGAMRSLTEEALSRTNESILRAMSGKRTDFGQAGADIFRSASGTLLRSAEGKVLSGLGIGGKKKPSGAAGDPLHVVVDTTAGVPSALAPFVQGMKLPSVTSSGGDESSGASGFVGKAAGLLANLFIPGFAEGVDSFGGGLAVVGEEGPELLNLPRGSNVTPNRKVADMMGGGGGPITLHVDARGATDPAQIHAAATRAVIALTPDIIRASVGAGRDSNSRMAPTARR